MRKLKDVEVQFCPKLVEIQFSWAFKSLEKLSIVKCESFKRIVYESTNELISCEGRLIFPSRVLNKLHTLKLHGCPMILDIQVVGVSESWKIINIHDCHYLQGLGVLSNLKKLKLLHIQYCDRLRVVEGVDELEFLDQLWVQDCGSLERLINVSNTKLPNDCNIFIGNCGKLRGVKKRFDGSIQPLKHYKEAYFDWPTCCGHTLTRPAPLGF